MPFMRADCTHHRALTRAAWLAAVALSVGSANAAAQTAQAPAVGDDTGAAALDENRWSIDASAYTYIVPEAANYVQPTVNANRDWLHLEARYNYEAVDAASAWVGFNIGTDAKVSWTVVPMLSLIHISEPTRLLSISYAVFC